MAAEVTAVGNLYTFTIQLPTITSRRWCGLMSQSWSFYCECWKKRWKRGYKILQYTSSFCKRVNHTNTSLNGFLVTCLSLSNFYNMQRSHALIPMVAVTTFWGGFMSGYVQNTRIPQTIHIIVAFESTVDCLSLFQIPRQQLPSCTCPRRSITLFTNTHFFASLMISGQKPQKGPTSNIFSLLLLLPALLQPPPVKFIYLRNKHRSLHDVCFSASVTSRERSSSRGFREGMYRSSLCMEFCDRRSWFAT